MSIDISEEEFEDLVDEGLRRIPEQLLRNVNNVAIITEDYHEFDPHILGLYEGVALPERTFDHTGYLPDAIFIYRRALQDWCNSEEELEHQVMVTVFHELGHY